MTIENFKKRLGVGLLFLVLSFIFFIVTSEDLTSYVIITQLPQLANTKLLVIHLFVNSILFGSKLAIAIMLMRSYNKLKGQKIPFVGFLWIFSVFFFFMGTVFLMNIIAMSRMYIWIDGTIRLIGAIFALGSAISFYRGFDYVSKIKSPEEYGRLADEIHSLREENTKLQRILEGQKTD